MSRTDEAAGRGGPGLASAMPRLVQDVSHGLGLGFASASSMTVIGLGLGFASTSSYY